MQVLSALGHAIDSTLGAVDSLASSMVVIAFNTNQKFPFVSIPEFAVIAAKTQQMTGAISMTLLPVVSYDQRADWEIYSSDKSSHIGAWVNKTLDLQDNYRNFFGPMPQNKTWESAEVLYDDEGDIPQNVSRPDCLPIFLPEWHRFPLVMSSYYPANWGM
jgi:hypothetical protein